MTRLIFYLGFILFLNDPCLSLSTVRRRGQSLRHRQTEYNLPPSVDSFVSRAYHSVIVLNNYLYIDGGEINFLDNRESEPVHSPDNHTYSIDLSSSWTNRTVTFNRIKKAAPVLNHVTLWADSTNSSIYAWGGGRSRAMAPDQSSPVPPNSVWKFTQSRDGSGTWSEQYMSSNSIFPSLTRPNGGTGTYGNGIGYLLGGYESAWTSPHKANLGPEDKIPTPGLVSYDTKTGTWKNESAIGYTAYGTALFGQLQFVPFVGSEGLLIALGGATSGPANFTDDSSNYLPFQEISIFNPATSTWYKQTATGSIPSTRVRFCSVGARGDNRTYEIFIYGGQVAAAAGDPLISNTEALRQRNIALDEVFVLSLPGFVWIKANYTAANPRMRHACNVIGKRQMIVTGGLNPASTTTSQLVSTKDVWTQGIGIFDMTTMEWKSEYNADAEPYITAATIKSWYAANGPYPAKWDDPSLEGLFNQSTSSSDSPPDSTNPDDSDDPESGSLENGPGPSMPNAGVITGAVVGGTAGLALIMAFIWFLMRRRRPQSSWSRTEATAAELYGTVGVRQSRLMVPEVQVELEGNTIPRSYLAQSLPQSQVPVSAILGDPRQEMP